MLFYNKKTSIYLDYLYENEFFFIQIFDKFGGNYKKIPPDIKFHSFEKNGKIDSLIAYTDSGLYYTHLKNEYVNKATLLIENEIYDLFSIYGLKDIVNDIYKGLERSSRNYVEYHVMKLDKEKFVPLFELPSGFKCIKCNESHFNELGSLQRLYHLEEVYDDGSYYPYEAEMKAFKNQMNKRLNYAVFDSEGKALSKSYVNAESPNCLQIGGNFTLKEYRNKGLSRMCLSYLINEAFSLKGKKNMLLFVKKQNFSAINVYKKLGFEVIFDTGLYYF